MADSADDRNQLKLSQEDRHRQIILAVCYACCSGFSSTTRAAANPAGADKSYTTQRGLISPSFVDERNVRDDFGAPASRATSMQVSLSKRPWPVALAYASLRVQARRNAASRAAASGSACQMT